MTNEQKKLLIHVNPVNAYHEFITTPELNETWEMLSTTASNALRIVRGVYTTKDEIIASQQALYMMLKLELI
jgi:hypothetical protein